MDKLDGMSMNLEKANMDKLHEVFPECFSEGKLDIDKLLSLCGEYIDNDHEKYKFEWNGKSECLRLAQKRSTGTLRPCPEESVNWDTTQNLYIEGDNLEVLKLLQTSYYRKVKMIYIDPPYNTGNDFVYADDFADPMARYKEVTQQTTKSNPETMGRYHTNWLNMMYPRLRLAANLLRDDGVIFISIDDNEVTNLRKVCDEVFGEENFIAQFIWHSRQNVDSRSLNGASIDHEYVLCYSKQTETRLLGKEIDTGKYKNPDNDPRGDWMSSSMDGLATAELRPNLHYTIINPETGKQYNPNPANGWRFQRSTVSQMIEEKRIIWPKNDDSKPRFKRYLNEINSRFTGFSSLLDVDYTLIGTKELRGLMGMETLKFPKPLSLIKTVISQATNTNDNDIILDFFSGSATTAHAVMQLNAEDGGNRRFIMVQLPELCDEKSEAFKAGYKNICEIGKERIRRAGAKILADTEEKNKQIKIGEEEKPLPDVGFKVFKLDTSNIKEWDSTPVSEEDYRIVLDRMNDMIDSIKNYRTDMDVVYEIMLKMGVPLTYPVQPIEIDGVKAYSVGEDGLLMVCLDAGITTETIERLADYAPAKIVIAESCFADVSAMRNAHYVLRDRKIELKLI
ncbi:MAG: site-specific DNA-methyltransferase [Clostridiales bacterium]|nr:site-specific DNA-methyltransferase [Clostridiales bacterium]